MPKLDVGVGDEFPAKEVREDPEEEPVVHHHHYYRRRYGYYRRPGRWLFFVLWILVISFAFRILDFGFGAIGGHWWGWGWDHGAWGAMKGTLWAILIIGGLIAMGWWGRYDAERDAERRERDDFRSGDGR